VKSTHTTTHKPSELQFQQIIRSSWKMQNTVNSNPTPTTDCVDPNAAARARGSMNRNSTAGVTWALICVVMSTISSFITWRMTKSPSNTPYSNMGEDNDMVVDNNL